MRFIQVPLLFLLLSVSGILSKDDSVNTANVENLKLLRKSVNFAYKAGNNFLSLIRGSTPPNVPVQRVFKLLLSNEGMKLSELWPVFQPYIGYASLILAGLLFVIFIPIVGLCFCCCRCCGKCGGNIKGMDPKHATCKRYTYALFLGIISIVQLAGIVLAFINNQLIHDTLTNPSQEISAVKQISVGLDSLKSSLTNISEAIKDTEKSSQVNGDSEINRVNFESLTCNGFLSTLKSDVTSLNINPKLQEISEALNATVDYISQVKQKNDKLSTYAVEFTSALSRFKIKTIQKKVCKELSTIAEKDFDGLKDFMRKQRSEQSTGKKLLDIVDKMNITRGVVKTNFDRTIVNDMKIEYLEYRMYIFIGICCLLLLIVLFYFLGLCFGQCGERPFEDARICNRGVGANLLMAGVAFAFLFTWMIMLLEMVLFTHGAFLETEFCRYVSDVDVPSVSAFDKMLKINPEFRQIDILKSNIFESIYNKCATESMAVSFNLDDNLMSPDTSDKVTDIIAKVKKMPNEIEIEITNAFFFEIEGLLQKIEKEVVSSRKDFDGFDEGTRNTIFQKLTSVSTLISQFSVATVKERFRGLLKQAASAGFGETLRAEMKRVLSKIYLSSYSHVKCDGIYRSIRDITDAACVTFLWPFNGFWIGVGICLVFTIPGIIFAVKLVGLYRRTEKYSADYEEPDYHSYMGFYTNNADNIPMKRPKSAKSNSKNRNSNSNNKESLKQNNPQYLPVYPYDAYE